MRRSAPHAQYKDSVRPAFGCLFSEDVAQKARKSDAESEIGCHDEDNRLGSAPSGIGLRLAAVSGISGLDGAVAEWLKAAVC